MFDQLTVAGLSGGCAKCPEHQGARILLHFHERKEAVERRQHGGPRQASTRHQLRYRCLRLLSPRAAPLRGAPAEAKVSKSFEAHVQSDDIG